MIKKLFCIFFMIPSVLFGATYYVDYVSGSDANAGTSAGADWQHCPGDSRAVSNANITLSSGDIVLFEGGVTYTLGSGDEIQANADNVTYRSGHLASYGSGRAIIDGNAVGAGTDASLYIAGWDQITVDGLLFDGSPSGATDAAIRWLYQIARGYDCNLVVTNCVIQNSDNSGVIVQGVGITGQQAGPATITDCIISNVVGHCIQFRGHVSNCVVKSCTTYDPGVGAGAADHVALSMIGDTHYTDVTIQDNDMFNSEDKGHFLLQAGGDGFIAERNRLGGTVAVSSVLVAGPQTNFVFRNNVVDCVSTQFEGTIRFRTDRGNSSACDGVEIYNNTFVGDSGPVAADGIIYFHQGNNTTSNHLDNVTIKNNVMDTTQNDKLVVYVGENSASSGPVINMANFVCDYNVYEWGTETTPFSYRGTNYNFADWKTQTSQDANSSNNDLTFTDEANDDFTLAAGDTSAIDQGDDLSATGFTDDKDGITRPQGAAWDIGAYEYFANWWDVWDPASSGLRIEGP